MANNLNIDLTNQYVVMRYPYTQSGDPLVERLFYAMGGFGCLPDTSGTAITGRWVADGASGSIRGYYVERLATPEEVKEALPNGWPERTYRVTCYVTSELVKDRAVAVETVIVTTRDGTSQAEMLACEQVLVKYPDTWISTNMPQEVTMADLLADAARLHAELAAARAENKTLRAIVLRAASAVASHGNDHCEHCGGKRKRAWSSRVHEMIPTIDYQHTAECVITQSRAYMDTQSTPNATGEAH